MVGFLPKHVRTHQEIARPTRATSSQPRQAHHSDSPPIRLLPKQNRGWHALLSCKSVGGMSRWFSRASSIERRIPLHCHVNAYGVANPFIPRLETYHRQPNPTRNHKPGCAYMGADGAGLSCPRSSEVLIYDDQTRVGDMWFTTCGWWVRLMDLKVALNFRGGPG